ncbi:MAG: hypothetical protein GY713_11655 [Actinomycetia bacterium]|nr:hypothetical protein [Actinomycetes bacterium]
MPDRRPVEIDEIRIVVGRGDHTSARRLAADVERALESADLDVATPTGHRAIAIAGGAQQAGLGARIVRAIEEQLR